MSNKERDEILEAIAGLDWSIELRAVQRVLKLMYSKAQEAEKPTAVVEVKVGNTYTGEELATYLERVIDHIDQGHKVRIDRLAPKKVASFDPLNDYPEHGGGPDEP